MLMCHHSGNSKWSFFLIGFFNTLNGIFIVYSSDPTRTPPVLQAILANTSIFWGILTTKLIVGKNAPMNYCQTTPIFSLLMITSGIILSLLPTVIGTIKGTIPFFHGAGGLIWSVLFMLGVIPGSIINVIEERFLKMRKREEKDNENRSRFFDMVVMLAYSGTCQLICMICLFWVDLIPNFGSSNGSIHAFFDNIYLSLKCFLHIDPHCTNNIWLGVLFTVDFLFNFIASALLNETSANYGLIASVISTP
eukprot:TRINITY_DN5768_c0_g1_i2.p1 TRINITY_DN5768_c0_g1~~TRINITY_DN5768_c0_g1_i2.p1  ORF type:complete len:250 (-),score=42.81 TRINITY_DN5768_c0_g1_i2:78-827(-)